MKIGLVGWASDTGVGMELRDTAASLPDCEKFLMPHRGRPSQPDSNETALNGWDPVVRMNAWIDTVKPDVVLTWETPVDWRFPEIWGRKGVRWVCVVHYDWFEPVRAHEYIRADLIAPNEQCRDGIRVHGLDSTVLPVPVDLNRLRFKERKYGHRFVTVYGQGGPHDRRSIKEIVEAWRGIAFAPPLTIKAQKKPVEIEGELPRVVGIDLENVATTAELYEEQDVALFPSKFEGVGLSLIEAQACGLPVITTDMEPMRTLAPDLLIPASPSTVEIMNHHRIPAAFPSIEALRRAVDGIMGKDIRALSYAARKRVEDKFSWTALKDRWMEFLRKGKV